MIRNSLDYVGWKDRKAVAAELKKIYLTTEIEAADALGKLCRERLGHKIPHRLHRYGGVTGRK